MELNFRKLRASEIDVRIANVNKGGVNLLLYKDARCDMRILDETVTPFGWQRQHKEIKGNVYAGLGIKDSETGEYVWKWDCGKESYTEAEKGESSDAFKRAAFNWGIGRALYTAPKKLFVFKDKLKGFTLEGSKAKCSDTFKCVDICYEGDFITSVTIALCQYDKEYDRVTFTQEVPKDMGGEETLTKASEPTPISTQTPIATPTPVDNGEVFKDDTLVLIGNHRKTYGELKGTDMWSSLIKWAANTVKTYDDPVRQAQFNELRRLGLKAS